MLFCWKAKCHSAAHSPLESFEHGRNIEVTIIFRTINIHCASKLWCFNVWRMRTFFFFLSFKIVLNDLFTFCDYANTGICFCHRLNQFPISYYWHQSNGLRAIFKSIFQNIAFLIEGPIWLIALNLNVFLYDFDNEVYWAFLHNKSIKRIIQSDEIGRSKMKWFFFLSCILLNTLLWIGVDRGDNV